MRRNCAGIALILNGLSFSKRGDILVEFAKENGTDCVVLCMMRFCDMEEYDRIYMIDAVSKAGLLTYSIVTDQSTSERDQAMTKIQAYAES